MHTVLLAAVMAAGSGVGSGEVSDVRTLEEATPPELLHLGMTSEEVYALLGTPEEALLLQSRSRVLVFRVGPDCIDRHAAVLVWIKDGRLREWNRMTIIHSARSKK
jgi:hypothetical protein